MQGKVTVYLVVISAVMALTTRPVQAQEASENNLAQNAAQLEPQADISQQGNDQEQAQVEQAEQKTESQDYDYNAISVADGRLGVMLPSYFAPMSEEMRLLKYPRQGAPTEVYSDPEGAVSLGVRATGQNITEGQLGKMLEILKRTLPQSHPEIEFLRSEIVPVGDQQAFFLDFRTQAVDTGIRNMMLGMSIDDELVMLAFNMTRELEEQWQDIGEWILLQSVTVQ